MPFSRLNFEPGYLGQSVRQRYAAARFIRFSEYHSVVHLLGSSTAKWLGCGRALPNSHIETADGYRLCEQCFRLVEVAPEIWTVD